MSYPGSKEYLIWERRKAMDGFVFRRARRGNPITMVVFRMYHGNWRNPDWKDPNWKDDLVALFPCQTPYVTQQYCGSYMHTGQYAPALYRGVISQTRPVTPEEAMPLADELKDIGYNIAVRQRGPSRHYKEKWVKMGND